MNQPDFGKKLVRIRKLKGLTQSELADRCEVSYRTIQRIETGIVTPRSFTINTLSRALDFDFLKELPFDLSEKAKIKPQRFILSKWIITQTIELFNLKTNIMKKLSILTAISGLIVFGLSSFLNKSNAQNYSEFNNFLTIESNESVSQKEAIKIIRKTNKEVEYHNQPIDLIKTYAKKSD